MTDSLTVAALIDAALNQISCKKSGLGRSLSGPVSRPQIPPRNPF